MSDYRVFLKRGGDNINIDLPDIYRDPDSETFSDQIKTYICSNMNLDYYSIRLDIKRNGRILKNCKDLEILNNDELTFYEFNNGVLDVTKLKMTTGFSNVDEKLYNNYNPQLIFNLIEKSDNEYDKIIDEIKREILETISSCSDLNIIEIINTFLIFSYNDNFFKDFPIHFYQSCTYFCRFNNGKPLGFGFMYDNRTKTYYEGNFQLNNIIQGRTLKMKDKKFLLICQAYSNLLACNVGTIKYLDQTESYDGFFLNGDYSGKGTLVNTNGIYIGNFIDSTRSGYGIMKYLNGDKYCGYWSRDKRNAFGKLIFNDGNYYSGVFVNDLFQEFGVYYDRESNLTYSGTFKDGQRTFNKDEYKIYNGHIFYSNFLGFYDIKLRDGDEKFEKISSTNVFDMESLYLSQMKRDNVTYSFKHKSRLYIGHFDYEASLYGPGRLFFDDNREIVDNSTDEEEPYSKEYLDRKYKKYREYQCMFSDKNANGFGIIKYSDGSTYIGNIKNGHKDGNGTLTKNNGEIEKAFWLRDIKKQTGYI